MILWVKRGGEREGIKVGIFRFFSAIFPGNYVFFKPISSVLTFLNCVPVQGRGRKGVSHFLHPRPFSLKPGACFSVIFFFSPNDSLGKKGGGKRGGKKRVTKFRDECFGDEIDQERKYWKWGEISQRIGGVGIGDTEYLNIRKRVRNQNGQWKWKRIT